MRVYLPLTKADLLELQSGSIAARGREAISATSEFAKTVETDEPDELDLIAAMAATDLHDDVAAVGVLEADAEVTDAALGEVKLAQDANIDDFVCLLTADIETQEVSWYGIQELSTLLGEGE